MNEDIVIATIRSASIPLWVWITLGIIATLPATIVTATFLMLTRSAQGYKSDYQQGHEQGYKDAIEDNKRSDKSSFHGYRKR